MCVLKKLICIGTSLLFLLISIGCTTVKESAIFGEVSNYNLFIQPENVTLSIDQIQDKENALQLYNIASTQLALVCSKYDTESLPVEVYIDVVQQGFLKGTNQVNSISLNYKCVLVDSGIIVAQGNLLVSGNCTMISSVDCYKYVSKIISTIQKNLLV
ncbi:MAG: hypothetical protein J6B81_02800 [Spirochaetaceae bacterium]|nr:hypothetical protein [Spirochaetaceae bacterium]